MGFNRAKGQALALTAVALSGLTGCAAGHAPKVARAEPVRTPLSIAQAYDSVFAVAPVGSSQDRAVSALETSGWECWGYAMVDSSIRDTRSGETMKGTVLTCQVLRGNEMNPMARKYTAQLVFEKDKLAGVQMAQRHNAF